MKQKKKKSSEGRWTRDPVKEQYWRTQLARWQASGLSIRAFCKEHGVVETSFYAWRRELIVRARESGAASEVDGAERMTPNSLKDARGRTVAIRYRQTDQPALSAVLQDEERSNPFVPIRIVHSADSKQAIERIPKQDNHVEKRSEVEIALPGGAAIRLTDDCNLRLVAELLSILKG